MSEQAPGSRTRDVRGEPTQGAGATTSYEVTVAAGRHAVLPATLTLPHEPRGVVAFAHGSGSSRHSPRNRHVAAELERGALGTLLIDLLTQEEGRRDEITRELRFDIPLLADRLEHAVRWLRADRRTRDLDVGLFGASTGSAAALIAAARRPRDVGAVVSRGGRPDLAGDFLEQVEAPTLLIVGGCDDVVVELNREAAVQMRAECRIEIVPGATHLFEEPGTLEQVARLARDWFAKHLATR
jgi:dienelactone hydrolase